MIDLRSAEYVSMNNHDRIRDTLLKITISGNRCLTKSALDITPHEEDQWDLCPGERGGQVEWAFCADLLNPNQVERRLGAEYCEVLNTFAAWPGTALP
jgi:hypothetical protein